MTIYPAYPKLPRSHRGGEERAQRAPQPERLARRAEAGALDQVGKSLTGSTARVGVYGGTVNVATARELALSLLVGLDTRGEHTRGVAAQAEAAAAAVGVERRDVLVSAAWLHDVGYAPVCVATGLHPLDGASTWRSVAMCRPWCASWWRITRERTSRRLSADWRRSWRASRRRMLCCWTR